MDGTSTPSARIAAYLLIPIALLLLLPIVLLFVVGYYLFVLVQSVRSLLGREAAVESALQKPHFLDVPASDQSTNDVEWQRSTGESHDRS